MPPTKQKASDKAPSGDTGAMSAPKSGGMRGNAMRTGSGWSAMARSMLGAAGGKAGMGGHAPRTWYEFLGGAS